MSSSSVAAAAVAAGAPKICFNANCKEVLTEQPRRKGWRLRSGEFAELCERCHSTFDQGNFCETFHSDSAGWRKCESCGKKIHCGCIVSIPAYMLLDVGGVECMACVRKTYSAVPNQVWSPSIVLPQVSQRSKEFPIKSWNQVSGSFPGQWRHPSNIWNSSSIQSDLHQRLSYEFDRPSNSEKLMSGARSSISVQEKRTEDLPERIASSGLNHVHRFGENGTISKRKGMMSDACSASSSCVNFETHQISSLKPSSSVMPKGDLISKGESSTLPIGLTGPLSSMNGISDPIRVSTNHPQHQAVPSTLPKQFYSNPLHSVHSGESQTQARNGKVRLDTRARTHLLPRYWPRISDQELQKISGDSNSVVTPLFEKMLSASDAGRIGRLVLPKKCAEAYFPTISQPEGLPLKMQDASGKEWVFQFRFWPNNNSRMYVLEGVTPCIQSMQLQAGDTVTFSRIDPEGKFLLGFRKASTPCNDQDSQAAKVVNGSSAPIDVKSSAIDFIANLALRPHKGDIESRNLAETTEKDNWSKNDKTGFIQKDDSSPKFSHTPFKRKSSSLGTKNKRLRIENEESVELNLTWEEAQVLIRPPSDDSSCVTSVSVEGHEFEEFEEGPVIGMPTYFGKSHDGDMNYRWVQCENCFKWRRLPLDALLCHRWTCADNKWDSERSSCSASQEISAEITHLLPMKNGPPKKSKLKAECESFEVSDGLDTLANLAILGETESLPTSSQTTTKHPRHRPGCTCIVCIQPPSGKGPKHKQTCTCNVCVTVKRRFQTLMLRREKQRQTEKDAENTENSPPAQKKQQNSSQSPPSPPSSPPPSPPPSPPALFPHDASVDVSTQMPNASEGLADDESERKKAAPSPIKTQIDLNIQPEREEEPSPVAVAGSMGRAFQDDLD